MSEDSSQFAAVIHVRFDTHVGRSVDESPDGKTIAQALRENARSAFTRWTRGYAGWTEVLQAVRWADAARNELTAVERAEHDRWLFRESTWGMT